VDSVGGKAAAISMTASIPAPPKPPLASPTQAAAKVARVISNGERAGTLLEIELLLRG